MSSSDKARIPPPSGEMSHSVKNRQFDSWRSEYGPNDNSLSPFRPWRSGIVGVLAEGRGGCLSMRVEGKGRRSHSSSLTPVRRLFLNVHNECLFRQRGQFDARAFVRTVSWQQPRVSRQPEAYVDSLSRQHGENTATRDAVKS
jgi:hypothetical protein